MKRSSKAILITAALCAALVVGLFAMPAGAVSPSQTTVTQRPGVTILADGVERTFYDVTGREVHPLYANGTHYLPVRAIGELMGKNVNWDAANRTISLTSPRTAPATVGTPDTDAKECRLTVEVRPDITIVVDGVEQHFQDAAGKAVYPLLTNGTNYLPVRAIGELMGKEVTWDENSKTITLGAVSDAPNVTDADTFQPTGTTTPAAPTTPTTSTAPSGLIGMEKAKSLALAQVPGAAAQHIVKCELDRDDGVWQYEIEIFYNYTEYEIELEGTTGRLLKLEKEYKGPANSTNNQGHHIEYSHHNESGHHYEHH